jgi:hypothetical protein
MAQNCVFGGALRWRYLFPPATAAAKVKDEHPQCYKYLLRALNAARPLAGSALL